VAYDVLIFGLMILGISTAVVFSYKIAHSSVYPVGMVRKMPSSQDSGEGALACESAPPADLIDFATEGEIIRHANVSEQTVRKYVYRMALRESAKQHLKGQIRKLQPIKIVLFQDRWETPFRGPEPEDVALEKEVAEHSETLEYHSISFAALEKRVRKLEVESVKKSQEIAKEKAQVLQPETVH
jgi:hypothetical protein